MFTMIWNVRYPLLRLSPHKHLVLQSTTWNSFLSLTSDPRTYTRRKSQILHKKIKTKPCFIIQKKTWNVVKHTSTSLFASFSLPLSLCHNFYVCISLLSTNTLLLSLLGYFSLQYLFWCFLLSSFKSSSSHQINQSSYNFFLLFLLFIPLPPYFFSFSHSLWNIFFCPPKVTNNFIIIAIMLCT